MTNLNKCLLLKRKKKEETEKSLGHSHKIKEGILIFLNEKSWIKKGCFH